MCMDTHLVKRPTNVNRAILNACVNDLRNRSREVGITELQGGGALERERERERERETEIDEQHKTKQ